ncbi:30S ribosomal protein S17 [Candidatus Peregrinibacteria bacterium]|nr:MAG: 30S ribosomal protein S17 [Candidatus Peregrinibacteria bacterium]
MRTKKGIVSKKSGDKTVVVTVHRYEMHPKYHKRYRVSKKFHAHDEGNTVQVGDEVVILETRPLSRLKRWRVVTSEEFSSLQQS